MRVLVDGKLYDSTQTPILIVFDENEEEMFNGMKRYVSAPPNTPTPVKQAIIETKID